MKIEAEKQKEQKFSDIRVGEPFYGESGSLYMKIHECKFNDCDKNAVRLINGVPCYFNPKDEVVLADVKIVNS